MDVTELAKKLAIGADDTVTLGVGLLPDVLDPLLRAYAASQPITVAGAALTTDGSTVTLKGTTTFLGVADVPLCADFAAAPDGSIVATLRFDLAPKQPAWTFGSAFPDLVPLDDDLSLGSLQVSSAAAVLTNAAGTDAVTHRPLVPGLNVVGTLDGRSMLGELTASLASTLDDVASVPMHAVVTAMLPDTAVPPAPVWPLRAWDAGGPVPGVTLYADVPLSIGVGGLTFGQTQLRAYAPPSQAWLDDNSGFQPVLAFTGTLTVSSAKIDLPVTATWQPSSALLDVDATLGDVVNLENVAALADFLHDGHDATRDVRKSLPGPVEAALGKVALQRAGVGLSFGASTSVEYAYFTIGVDGLDWDVFAGLMVDSVAVDVTVIDPFGPSRGIVTGVGADLTLDQTPLDVYVTNDDGLFVRVSLPDGETLPLRRLFEKVVPSLPAPPDLVVDSLSAQCATDGSYAFSTTLADSTPWTLDLGATTLAVSDVTVDATKDPSGTAAAYLAGRLVVAGVEVDASYATPGDFSVRATLPELKLSALASEFSGALPTPSGWDLVLPSSYLLIDGPPDALTFTVMAQVEDVGLVAFAAQRTSGGTVVAAGIDLRGGTTASGLFGLHALSVLDGLLDELMVVASTMDQTTFQFPSITAFQAPALPARGPALPQAGGLVKGLNVYGRLRSSGNRGLRALLQFLGIPFDGTVGAAIAVTLPDPGQGSSLSIAVDGTVSGVAIKGQAGLLLTNDQPGAYLQATATATIQATPVTGTVNAEVLADGVLVQGSLAGSVTFGPVTLSDLALVVGIDWEAIPSLGVAATIDVEGVDASVAVFFDSADPSSSMFAGSISGGTLGVVARSLAGSSVPPEIAEVLDGIGLAPLDAFRLPSSVIVALHGADLAGISAAFTAAGAPALPSASNQVLLHPYDGGWHLATIDADGVTRYTLVPDGDGVEVRLDPQVYFVPRAVTLVGLPPYEPAFRVAAEIDLYAVTAQVHLDIVPSSGITADLDVSPIDVGGVFAVTNADGSGGPRLSLATFKDDSRPDPATRPPHFFLSGRVAILGATVASCQVSVEPSGLRFASTVSPVDFVSLSVDVTASSRRASVTATGTVGIDKIDLGPLGSIDADKASVQVGASFDGTALTGSVGVAVSLLGHSWPMHTVGITVTADLLAHLGEAVIGQVESLGRDFLSDATRWTNAVKDGFVRGIEDGAAVVGVLTNEFKKAPAEAAAIARDAGYAADEVAKGLDHALADLAKVARGTDSVASKALADLRGEGRQVAAAMLQGGYAAKDVGKGMASAFDMTASQVGLVLHDAGQSLETVGKVLREGFGCTAKQTGAFFRDVYGETEDGVKAALRDAGYTADDVGDAVDYLFSSKSPLDPGNW